MRRGMLGRSGWSSSVKNTTCLAAVAAAVCLGGCAHSPNQFVEDGPSVFVSWNSPTADDVLEHTPPAEPRQRDWEPKTVTMRSGAVTHWPLYFEDPFVDKGDGRTDETHPGNVHRLGWEDLVAVPYGLARHTVNWLFLPVSAIVTPPWTLMVSDGRLSKQALGYDHDATRATPDNMPEALVPQYGTPGQPPSSDHIVPTPPPVDPAEDEVEEAHQPTARAAGAANAI